MRHLKSGRKLGRTTSHRKALLSNIAAALIEHKSIVTTKAKAKEARSTVERLITFAKKGDLASRRQVLKTIRNKDLVKQLFDDIAPKYEDRAGGYTRVIKLGLRKGDNAPMAILEMVGYENIQSQKIEKQRKKREAKEKQEEAEANQEDNSSKDE